MGKHRALTVEAVDVAAYSIPTEVPESDGTLAWDSTTMVCVEACAGGAADIALWDLKARPLDMPLVMLLGQVRPSVPIYGSGGFTSYTMDELQRHLSAWVEAGISRVKMKVGSHPHRDLERVRAARQAIGPEAELFVDANGAYTRTQALLMAARFAEQGVTWFEEPVSSDDIEGLRLGVPTPRDGALAPDTTRPGHGLTLRRKEAARHAV